MKKVASMRLRVDSSTVYDTLETIHGTLFLYANRYADNPYKVDADDLYQQACLKIVEASQRRKFANTDHFRKFSIVVARGAMLNMLRSEKCKHGRDNSMDAWMYSDDGDVMRELPATAMYV